MSRHAAEVAPLLIGAVLTRTLANGTVSGRIVEVEAYDQTDPASHSYRGRTPRTSVMFGPAGVLYVYFTYGMHYCCNLVCGPIGTGAAVLIRAIEPLSGLDLLRAERHRQVSDRELTNGPAKLCQAFRIDQTLNGHDVTRSPLTLALNPPVPNLVQTTRIGLSRAIETPWRFYEADNPWVSHR
jgi:DNA-3-methyladenine glycosylase